MPTTVNGRVPTKLAFQHRAIFSRPTALPADRFGGDLLGLRFIANLGRFRAFDKYAADLLGDLPDRVSEYAAVDARLEAVQQETLDSAALDTLLADREANASAFLETWHAILVRKFGFLYEKVDCGDYDLLINPQDASTLDALDDETDRAAGRWPVLAFLVSSDMLAHIEVTSGPF